MYVPVRLGNLTTAAFIDSGNTFGNVISPQTMTALGIFTAQLEPVPQLSVGTAAAGKKNENPWSGPPHQLPDRAAPRQVPYPPTGLAGPGTSGEYLWPLSGPSRN